MLGEVPSDPDGASSLSPVLPPRWPGGESCRIVLRPTAPPARRLFFPITVSVERGGFLFVDSGS